MDKLIEYIESNLLTCPTKQLLEINCLGCGMQRSFILLLKGEVLSSVQMYPALLPMIFTFGYLIAHLLFKFKNGAKVLLNFYILTSILIIVNYFIKL